MNLSRVCFGGVMTTDGRCRAAVYSLWVLKLLLIADTRGCDNLHFMLAPTRILDFKHAFEARKLLNLVKFCQRAKVQRPQRRKIAGNLLLEKLLFLTATET